MAGARLAIALVSASVLVFEIAMTRVLSVVLWYHFAFLSITLALLGIGAPGVWCSVFPPGPRFLQRSLLATAILIPLALFAIMHTAKSGLAEPLAICVLAMLAPLVAAGSAVFRLLDLAKGREIGAMYGADLLGAATGALVVVPLMHQLSTVTLIFGCALLPLAAAILIERRPTIATASAAILIAGMLLFGEPAGWLPVGKRAEQAGDARAGATIVLRKWTPTSLITVFETKGMTFMWGRGSKFREGGATEEMGVELDGSAGTIVARADRPLEEMPHLFYDVTSIAYRLRTIDRVCVIGAGGGRDVLTALKGGAKHVDAVELNADLIDILSGPLAARTGDVYHLPGVHAQRSEGRSFLSRSAGNYDVIQLSLIDSWAATSAGAFSLSENNLYTVEAYRTYWNKLSAGGLISTSRWFSGKQQMETVRLVEIAIAALELEGVKAPRDHLALVSAGRVGTLLISKTKFTADELAKLDALADEYGFVRHWPMEQGGEPKSLPAQVLATGPEQVESWGFDIEPSTDDRPFFFQTVRLFGDIAEEARSSVSVNEQAVLMLRGLIFAVALLAALLFFLPLVLAKRIERAPGFWSGAGYFLAIGLAFMLVEVPWIQRFILYLGHPSHATTVVLAALLVGAGTGSMVAGRFAPEKSRKLGIVVPLSIALVSFALEPIFHVTLSLPLAARIAISAAILIPAGFTMGLAFPAGMIAFGDRNKAWFWAINGVASVLASVCSVGFSIALGFTNVLMLGVMFYLVAWLVLLRARVE